MITKESFRGLTPEGGDYSEIFYFDDDGNATDKSEASKIMIRELLDDGTVVNETRMSKKK